MSRYAKPLLWFLWGLLVFLAIFPRITPTLSKNYIFLFDQGRDYLAVRDIVLNHKQTLIGAEIGAGAAGISYIFHGPGYYYLLTIPFILFHGDPYGGVVLMFVLGVLSVGLAFLLGRRLFGLWGGVILGLLLSISPPFIGQSYFIWNSYPATPVILLAFYFLYRATAEPERRNPFLFLAVFFSGFMYNFELAMAVPMTLGTLLYTIVFLRAKKVVSYLFVMLGLGLAYLPMAFFEIRHKFPGLESAITYIFSHKTTHGPSITQFLTDHFQVFLHNGANTFPQEPSALMYGVWLLFIGTAIYFLRREKEKARKLFLSYLLLLSIVSFLVFSLLKNQMWQHYLYYLEIGYMILASYSISQAMIQKKNALRYVLPVVFGYLLLLGSISAVQTFHHDYSDYGGGAKIKGKEAALDTIYQDANGKPFGLLIFQPPIYTYPYDYLLQWYAKQKYGYVPYQDQKGTFYLLMEEDFSQPWTYKGWLETRITKGKVIYTKTLENGLFLQKRIVE